MNPKCSIYQEIFLIMLSPCVYLDLYAVHIGAFAEYAQTIAYDIFLLSGNATAYCVKRTCVNAI